jgi:hypothetical protein
LGQRGKRLVFTETVSNEFVNPGHELNSAQMGCRDFLSGMF